MRRLVRAGLVPRPDSNAYVVGLIGQAWDRGRLQLLTEDPDLLSHGVWRLFEVEGGGENSLAAVDRYAAEEDSWSATLRTLAADSRLDRDRLLDASLAALGRDFASFRAGWFSRFHEALEPTTDERAARADAYARLLTAPVPNTVSFALKALQAVAKDGRLEPTRELAERLAPALASDRKATVNGALRLLRGAQPEVAALAACGALTHEDGAIQGKALDVVEAGLTPAVRTRLLEVADLVAPTVRDRVAALVGLDLPVADEDVATPDLEEQEARAAGLPAREAELAGVRAALEGARKGALPNAVVFAVADVPVLASAEPVLPIADVDELVDVVARIVEQAVPDLVDFERALDGLSRLGRERPEDFGARTASVRRRAQKRLWDGEQRLVLIDAWLDGVPPAPDLPVEEWAVPEIISHARARELATRIAEGRAEPLLAAPTHADGWVDPQAFVARLADVADPGRHDLIAALCRLGPDRRDEAVTALDGLDHACAPLVRAALGGPPVEVGDRALAAAVDLARELDRGGPSFRVGTVRLWDVELLAGVTSDEVAKDLRAAVPALTVGLVDEEQYIDRTYEPGMGDAALVRAELALRPAGHQAFWSRACFDLATNIDAFTVAYRDATLLVPALVPDRPLGELGTLAIVLGLSHGDAATRASAVDAAIAGIEDGRLDEDGLGAAARLLLGGVLGKPTRLGPALGTVASESPLHAEVARRTLEQAVALDQAPRGLHAMLSVLNELNESAGAAVTEPGARKLLVSLQGSSKAAKLAKALLAREGESRLVAAAGRLAAGARIARAERWAAGATRP